MLSLWGVLHVSGFSEYLYMLIYTSPKAKKIGKTIFGIGQSIIGAVVFAIMTQTGLVVFGIEKYIAVTIFGLGMIVFGTILEEK